MIRPGEILVHLDFEPGLEDLLDEILSSLPEPMRFLPATRPCSTSCSASERPGRSSLLWSDSVATTNSSLARVGLSFAQSASLIVSGPTSYTGELIAPLQNGQRRHSSPSILTATSIPNSTTGPDDSYQHLVREMIHD